MYRQFAPFVLLILLSLGLVFLVYASTRTTSVVNPSAQAYPLFPSVSPSISPKPGCVSKSGKFIPENKCVCEVEGIDVDDWDKLCLYDKYLTGRSGICSARCIVSTIPETNDCDTLGDPDDSCIGKKVGDICAGNLVCVKTTANSQTFCECAIKSSENQSANTSPQAKIKDMQPVQNPFWVPAWWIEHLQSYRKLLHL